MLVLRRSPKVTATSVDVQVAPATDHLNAIAVSAARPPAMTSVFSTVGRVFSRNVFGRLKGRPEAPSLDGVGSRPLTTEPTPGVDGIGSAYIRARPAAAPKATVFFKRVALITEVASWFRRRCKQIRTRRGNRGLETDRQSGRAPR